VPGSPGRDVLAPAVRPTDQPGSACGAGPPAHRRGRLAEVWICASRVESDLGRCGRPNRGDRQMPQLLISCAPLLLIGWIGSCLVSDAPAAHVRLPSARLVDGPAALSQMPQLLMSCAPLLLIGWSVRARCQMPQLLMSRAPFVNSLWTWPLPRVTSGNGFHAGRIRFPSCSSSIRSSRCTYIS
jgi:hypothetical protein